MIHRSSVKSEMRSVPGVDGGGRYGLHDALFDTRRRVTSAGPRESHPHDVVVTREAPNYSL